MGVYRPTRDNRPVTRSDPKNPKMARFGSQVAPYGQIVVYNGTWGQYLLPQQVPAQTEPRRPKNHPIPCFPTQGLDIFYNISGLCRKFSKMGPKIGPRPFPEQFRAAKRAPEFRGQKIKRSHDRPILAFQLRGNFRNFNKFCASGSEGQASGGSKNSKKYMHLLENLAFPKVFEGLGSNTCIFLRFLKVWALSKPFCVYIYIYSEPK